MARQEVEDRLRGEGVSLRDGVRLPMPMPMPTPMPTPIAISVAMSPGRFSHRGVQYAHRGSRHMHHTLHVTRAREAGDSFSFRFGREQYQLHGEGDTVATATLDWNDELIDDLARLRAPDCDPSVIQRVGERIREFLGEAGWDRHEAAIERAVRDGERVVLTIRSTAAELTALPWELATIAATGQRLGELPGVLIRHAWPGTTSHPALRPGSAARREGGRILLVSSDSLGAVPLEEHRAAIERACQRGHARALFDRERDVIQRASLDRLAEVLEQAEKREQPIAVLHVLCHGTSRGQRGDLGHDADDSEELYGLGWYDDQGRPTFLSPDRLRAFFSQDFARRIGLVVLAACDSGNLGALGNQVGAVAQAIHQAGVPTVIGSRFALSVRGSNRLADELYGQLLGGPSSLEDAFLSARHRLLQTSRGLDWASLQLYARPEDDGEDDHGDARADTRPVIFRPYRGLLAFHAEHTRFFFGRAADRAKLLGDLRALVASGKPRFLVVAGASGTGKSSMVLAGAIPDLIGHETDNIDSASDASSDAAGSPWHVEIMRPAGDPMGGLDRALARWTDRSRRLLLVVDQFEELFTQTDDAEVRRDFVQRLWSLASRESGFHCAVTLRVDFLGHCGEVVVDGSGLRLDRIAYDEAHRVFVAHMDPAAVRAAIEEPAAMVGLRLEAGLAERIVADVEGEPGSLPLLQYTLDLLWQRREGRLLTAASYGELGGVVGALQSKADRVLDNVRDELGDAGLAHARRLLVQTVDVRDDRATDTRRRVLLAEVAEDERSGLDRASAEVLAEVLDRLIEARLVVRDEQDGEPVLEVAHEALIRKWDRLQGWLAEDREKLVELEELRRMARQCEELETLLLGEQLGYARRVQGKYGEELDGKTVRLIAESVAAENKSRRWRQVALAAALAAAVIMAILAVWGAREARNAEDATQEAESEKRLAEKRAKEVKAANESLTEQLASAATTSARLAGPVMESEPLVALHHLLDAIALDPDGQHTSGRRQAARTLAGNQELLAILEHRGPVTGARFHDSEPRILTWSQDGTARVWSSDTGEPITPAMKNEQPVQRAAFNRDASRVLTWSGAGTVRVWNADTGQPITDPVNHDDGIRGAIFGRDGSRILIWRADHASKRGVARVWNGDTGQPVTPSMKHDGEIYGAVFSEDETRVLTWSDDGTARVWDSATGLPVAPAMRHRYVVNGATFNRDSSRVLTWGNDGTARVWSSDTGEPLSLAMQHPDSIAGAMFSEDESRILTWGDDGAEGGIARVWNGQTGAPITPAMNHRYAIDGAVLSEDGSRVLSWSGGLAQRYGTAWVWSGDTGERLSRPMQHDGLIQGARFGEDRSRVLTWSGDGAARVWTSDTGRPITPRMNHQGSVEGAVFGDEASRVLTWSEDGSARVWDGDTGLPITPPMKHADRVWGAAFNADESRILTWGRDGSARVWNGDTGRPITRSMLHQNTVQSAVFSAGESRILTWSEDNTARVWNGDTGEPITMPMAHEKEIRGAAFGADGFFVVTWSLDGTAQTWYGDSGMPATPPMKHRQQILGARLNEDASRILTWSADGTARVWNGHTGQPITGFMSHAREIHGADLGQDPSRVLTWSADKTARVWNGDTGEPITPPLTHQGDVHGAIFGEDGSRVLTWSGDGTARVWHGHTGEPITSAMKHRNYVLGAVFSEDESRVLTWSADKTARVWSSETGEPITSPMDHLARVWGAAFTADRARILTWSEDYTARVWNGDTGAPITPPLQHQADVHGAGFSEDGSRAYSTQNDHPFQRIVITSPVPRLGGRSEATLMDCSGVLFCRRGGLRLLAVSPP